MQQVPVPTFAPPPTPVSAPTAPPLAIGQVVPAVPTGPDASACEEKVVRVRASVSLPPEPESQVEKPVIRIGNEPSFQGSPPPAPSAAFLKHAPDYGWLVGELQYLQTRHTWRLRYARPGDEDRYGGTVTLTGEALPATCSDGEIVRVEGRLVNPDSVEPRPAYWVNTLKVIKAAPPAVQE
jgi:hypothetical protein